MAFSEVIRVLEKLPSEANRALLSLVISQTYDLNRFMLIPHRMTTLVARYILSGYVVSKSSRYEMMSERSLIQDMHNVASQTQDQVRCNFAWGAPQVNASDADNL
jgi:hypothetical protein